MALNSPISDCMNLRILGSIALRYFWLYTRHPVRIIELVFWPFVQLLVWGFLTKYHYIR